MVVCPNCSKNLIDGTTICDNCGSLTSENVFCQNCGEQTEKDSEFCPKCGTSLLEDSTENITLVTTDKKTSNNEKASKKTSKIYVIGGIIFVSIMFVVLLFGYNSSNKNNKNFAVYLKDRDIFVNELNKNNDHYQLTSNLFNYDIYDNADIDDRKYEIESFTHTSKDGSIIFFPDKIDSTYNSINLYYKTIKDTEAIKIASNVKKYRVNEKSSVVTYIDKERDALYQYTLKSDTKDKIANEVEEFNVSSDGNDILFKTFDGGLYLKFGNKDKEKITSEVTEIVYYSENLKNIYYMKEDVLYKYIYGKDPIKIAEDIYEVAKVYDTGEIYYLRKSSDEYYLSDFIYDDMYEKDLDTYTSATIEERDELRKRLAETMFEYFEDSIHYLYFYDGKKESLVEESLFYGITGAALDTNTITYVNYNHSDFNKINLSEIYHAIYQDYEYTYYDIENMIIDELPSGYGLYIGINDTSIEIEQIDSTVFKSSINTKGDTLYYFDNVYEEEGYGYSGDLYGDLYRVFIKDGVVSKPEIYDSNVYVLRYCLSDDKNIYFKDFYTGEADLYIDKTKIDSDVTVARVDYYEDENKIIYFTDYNNRKQYGTLKLYDNNSVVKIADDVNKYELMKNGEILYLSDYSVDTYTGELHEWDNGESRELDEDVMHIFTDVIPVYMGGF